MAALAVLVCKHNAANRSCSEDREHIFSIIRAQRNGNMCWGGGISGLCALADDQCLGFIFVISDEGSGFVFD